MNIVTMKRIIIIIFLLFWANSHAGINNLTWHSRANCGNNESITWHLGHSYDLMTISRHYRCQERDCLWDNKVCEVEAHWEHTWRSAAVHWGEALPGSGWWVYGTHWIIYMGHRQPTLLSQTDAYDCNIYDGWWDQN